MEGVLWQLLASSRGGPTRVRIVRALDERPRNANELADELGMDYTTIRHHLDVLMENNVVRRTDDDYAAVYLFTDQLRTNRDTLDEVLDTVDPDGGSPAGEERSTGDRGADGEERPTGEDSAADGENTADGESTADESTTDDREEQ